MPSVAIIGASADRSKFGNKSVRAHAIRGFQVYPVNPHESSIEGWPVFRSICDVPAESLDRVSVYLPPTVALSALDEIAKKTVAEVWLNPGADFSEVVNKAKRLGLHVITGCSIVALGISPADLN